MSVLLIKIIILKRGWRATVSTRSGFVVRSHGRLLADRQDYATEAKEWAELIADNRIAELSQNWIFANYCKDRSMKGVVVYFKNYVS
jgi:hypothetical protein